MRQDVNPASAESRKEYSKDKALTAAPVTRAEHIEGSLTLLIEQQTAKVPSHVFLCASLVSMGISLGAEILGRERAARFVAMWVAPLLIMGVYNKMVKTFGAR